MDKGWLENRSLFYDLHNWDEFFSETFLYGVHNNLINVINKLIYASYCLLNCKFSPDVL